MDVNQTIYQIYPLGFCGAPKENDGILSHRILHVLDWVDHLSRLGITRVMFNPVFESDRHGYDTRDFTKIDCRLGTNEDFATICHSLHDHGIGVILDGVFNHVGRGFPMFQDVRERKWDSPYKDWFYINFNDTWAEDGFTYGNWEGHNELVKLNLQNPEVKAYLFQAVEQWISEFQIDGIRLDVAYCLDRNFMRELSDSLHSRHPDLLLIGEMIGGDYNVLFNEGHLDSVTNYECRKGLFSSMNSKNLFEIGYSLNRQFGPDPWCLYTGKHLLSFADNHDVDRLASVLSDERDLPLTYDLIYAMPGIPCIYYGSEWGERGTRTRESDDALRPYIETPIENELSEHIKALNHLRRDCPILTYGDYRQVATGNEFWAFTRSSMDGTVLFAINISEEEKTIFPSVPITAGVNLVNGESLRFDHGLRLAPKSSLFLLQTE
ncbi:MAG: cyclomaltodextrinase [Solobacterium sp.]|nr:cyclomaltodextrinase [Solobacterium sp.]